MMTIGSVWQKWDLHVHTPASYEWKGQRFDGQTPTQKEASCRAILDAMNASDVVAFCVMDYWTFDGYLLLRQYMEAHPGYTTKKIFPGIEFRLEAPTNYRLNAHVLMNDILPVETFQAFLAHLKLCAPNGKPATRPNFIELGKSYDLAKLAKHSFKAADRADDEKMLRLGMMTAEVSRDSLEKAIDLVGKEDCLFILPFDTNDGISGLDFEVHSNTAASLMKWADCFEARKQAHVDLILGRGHATKPQVGVDFLHNLGGSPKPVFSGSDAHNCADYGVYPSGRITWLKAQPTFKGLRQVCHEPALRCHIGDRPEKLEHMDQNPTKYIRRLRLAKVDDSTLTEEDWFDGCKIELNPGLVAIIGNKGSGKSALADILALAGNSHCQMLEFLTNDRFRGTGNKAEHFIATLTWNDETDSSVNLARNADTRNPSRVRYLPQHFIENLCNEIASGNETNFGRELKKVIFSHVPYEQQLGKGSLDELLDYLIEARKQSIGQLQQSLRILNEAIIRNEIESSNDSLMSYRTTLALKRSELDALDNLKLDVVEPPAVEAGDPETQAAIHSLAQQKSELSASELQIERLREERISLTALRARLERLSGHVDNFEAHYNEFVEDHGAEFTDAGLTLDSIVALTITRSPVMNAFAGVDARLIAIASALDGQAATESAPAIQGLLARKNEFETAIEKLQDNLNAPQKAYQVYLNELAKRSAHRVLIVGSTEKPDTIAFIEDRIQRATESIPLELETQRQDRCELVRKLHNELLAIRTAYEQLYGRVQKIASDAATSTHAVNLQFDASIVTVSFEQNFLDFIHRGRRGNFYGEDESRETIKNLLRGHNFNDTDSVVAFTHAILEKLCVMDRGGEKESIPIGDQLRDKKSVQDLYDYIFGLDYLEVRYNLRLGGKDISQLSPGEKGALLLVFYLLLDTEEIPIIIDQPEHNLDNESVVRLLVDCIRKARARRQVFIVTHNPNLAVYCDADQIICCCIDKVNGNKIEYTTGAIEDYDINSFAVNVLEGTYHAFDNRRRKWHKPLTC